MPRSELTVQATMSRESPIASIVIPDGDVVDSADGGIITGWTRDDILLIEGRATQDVTFPVNSYARGRTNDVTATLTLGDQLLVPLRMFPPELFDHGGGTFHFDISTLTVYAFLLNVQNPMRGGLYDGAASAGSRDALTVNELTDVGDVHGPGDFSSDGDSIVAANDAYLPNWSHDDLIVVGASTAGTTLTLPVASDNPYGRTNDNQVGLLGVSEQLIHCGLLLPELYDQGGMLHLDTNNDDGSANANVVRARHIW